MSSSERLEALGPRGEACIILRAEVNLPNGTRQMNYTLASGERLKTLDEPGTFETHDGRRRFRLRSAGPAAPDRG